MIAAVAFLLVVAGAFGWKLRGWYDRRLNPVLNDEPVIIRKGNVYQLPLPPKPYNARITLE